MRRFLDLLFDVLFRGFRIGVPVSFRSPVRVAVDSSGTVRRVLLAFLLLFFAGRIPGRSCSLAPTPLWRMLGEADLVVVARVERLETRSIDFTMMEGEKEAVELTDIHLAVLETWKGTAPNWIIVSWEEGLEEGDLVVAVLQSDETLIRGSEERDAEEVLLEDVVSDETESLTDEDRRWLETSDAEWRESVRGRWHPVGSSGIRRVIESDLRVLSTRIREALRFQAQGGASDEEYRAWLISRAERRATRSDALWELMFGELPGTSPQAETGWRITNVLTVEELARIRDGFIAEPSGDDELSLIIRFFEGHPDATFDLAVASAVEGMLARSRADDSTARAVRDAVMRVTAPESPVDVHVTPEVDQLRSVWEEVLERWAILRPPAADIPERPER